MYQLEPAEIDFKADGTPVSRVYGDIYFQPEGGADEATYVFLKGCELLAQFAKREPFFNLLEMGFGTGLNFILTMQLFLAKADRDSHLTYVAIEKHPLRKEDMTRVAALFPALAAEFARLLAFDIPLVKGRHYLRLHPRITLILCYGEILDVFTEMRGQFDAIYADGFAPAKNEAMWTDEVIKALPKLCHQGTRFASFTAAGAVRRSLTAVGFAVTLQKGFGRKREMIVARFEKGAPKKITKAKRVRIIGGGIAGVLCAEHLKRYGVNVTLFEKGDKLGHGASGNAVGAVYPKLTAAFSHYGDLHLNAFLYAQHYYRAVGLEDAGLFVPSGAVMMAKDDEDEKRLEKIARFFSAQDFCGFYDAQDLSAKAGALLPRGGLFYPRAGKLRARGSLEFLGKDFEVRLGQDGLMEMDNDEDSITIITVGADLKRHLPIKAEITRGQISLMPRAPFLAGQKAVICHEGYVIDEAQAGGSAESYLGASYERVADVADHDLRLKDHAGNVAKLNQLMGDVDMHAKLDEVVGGRTAYRLAAADRLPYVGRVDERRYVLGALGSHGLTLAPLLAASVVAEILALPLPLAATRYDKLCVTRGLRME
jgi:tRNA 5-methylaminomethyl-2-thiouridine biosynthesis bifunctional protein